MTDQFQLTNYAKQALRMLTAPDAQRMPAGVAVDWLRDQTGLEAGEAVDALLSAMADDLFFYGAGHNLFGHGYGLAREVTTQEAEFVRNLMQGGKFDTAQTYVNQIVRRVAPATGSAEYLARFSRFSWIGGALAAFRG